MTATPSAVPTDIEIAQRATMRPIRDVAAELGLGEDDIDLYGRYKAKLPLSLASAPPKGRLVLSAPPKGRLVLVTAINPTPAGEGKSTVSVGLSQAFRRLGHNAVLCMLSGCRRRSAGWDTTPCCACANRAWGRCSA